MRRRRTNKTNKTYILLLLGVGVAFILGYQAKKKEKELAEKAGELALGAASGYIKSQSQITKEWFNSISNQWKQIWG